jgi:hypothetical protein
MTNKKSTSQIEPSIEVPTVDRQQKIAARGHELWIERGCPNGSPDEDWFQAEQELQRGATADRTAEQCPVEASSIAAGKHAH